MCIDTHSTRFTGLYDRFELRRGYRRRATVISFTGVRIVTGIAENVPHYLHGLSITPDVAEVIHARTLSLSCAGSK